MTKAKATKIRNHAQTALNALADAIELLGDDDDETALEIADSLAEAQQAAETAEAALSNISGA